jgi:hypothetical protein
LWVATRDEDEEEEEHDEWVVKGIAVEVKLLGMGAEEEVRVKRGGGSHPRRVRN